MCFYGQSAVTPEIVNPEPPESDQCPHVKYKDIVSAWSKSLSYVNDLDERDQSSVQLSLDVFTIVRDPFDRLVSYFHFYRKIYPDWKNSVSEAQNERIMANDLEGWMEAMHSEGGSNDVGIPYQHHFFANDADEAIALIQGDSPQIFTLLNECFATSVRLLIDKKPQFFVAGGAESFLANSSMSVWRVRKEATASRATLDRVRKKAMVWFEDDFRFYDAARESFRRHLATSNLSSSEIEACNRRLAAHSIYSYAGDSVARQ